MVKTRSNDAKRKSVINRNLKSRIDKNKNEEQGFVLIVGLIVMMVLLLLAVPFLYQLSFENRLTTKSYKSSAALSLAEAGVDRAIWELNYGDISSWSGDSSLRTMTISSFDAANGDVIGDIEIRVEDPGGGNTVVKSTGRVAYTGSLTVAKTVRVQLGGFSVFKFGAFGNEGIMIDQDVLIDSYDSKNGPYGDPNVDSEGDIGTNSVLDSSIFIAENSNIYGDVISGYGSDPNQVITTAASANIYGETEPLPSEQALPSISPPAGLPYGGGYSLSGQDTISGNREYSSFTIGTNSTVTIEGDVTLYITGGFFMDQNSTLEIAPNANLTIYLGGGTFGMDQSSNMNTLSEDPTNLLIYGTDSFTGEIYVDQASQFYGAVYAPQGSVRLDQDVGFYGSVVAKNIQLDLNTAFHYDKALEELNILPSMGADYEVKSWQVKLSQ